ncbi:uncharacterized protein LOC144351977 [Saccoglossus kowalevskii]
MEWPKKDTFGYIWFSCYHHSQLDLAFGRALETKLNMTPFTEQLVKFGLLGKKELFTAVGVKNDVDFHFLKITDLDDRTLKKIERRKIERLLNSMKTDISIDFTDLEEWIKYYFCSNSDQMRVREISNDLGIATLDDLKLVEEQDLKDFEITMVFRRKMLMFSEHHQDVTVVAQQSELPSTFREKSHQEEPPEKKKKTNPTLNEYLKISGRSFPYAGSKGMKLYSVHEIRAAVGMEKLRRRFLNEKVEELCRDKIIRKWSKVAISAAADVAWTLKKSKYLILQADKLKYSSHEPKTKLKPRTLVENVSRVMKADEQVQNINTTLKQIKNKKGTKLLEIQKAEEYMKSALSELRQAHEALRKVLQHRRSELNISNEEYSANLQEMYDSIHVPAEVMEKMIAGIRKKSVHVDDSDQDVGEDSDGDKNDRDEWDCSDKDDNGSDNNNSDRDKNESDKNDDGSEKDENDRDEWDGIDKYDNGSDNDNSDRDKDESDKNDDGSDKDENDRDEWDGIDKYDNGSDNDNSDRDKDESDKNDDGSDKDENDRNIGDGSYNDDNGTDSDKDVSDKIHFGDEDF